MPEDVASKWEKLFGMRPDTRPTDELIQFLKNTSNPHKHQHRDLVALEGSIDKAGFKNIILLWLNPETGLVEVIYGGGRILSGSKKGYEELPVVWATDMDKVKAKFLRLADNRTKDLSTKYDDNIIIEDLKSLKMADFDYSFLKMEKYNNFLIEDLAASDPIFQDIAPSYEGREDMSFQRPAPLPLGSQEPDLKKPQQAAFDPEPNKSYVASGMGLADTLYPGEPEFGIPILSLKYQATEVPARMVKWGEVSAKEIVDGCHFYAYDQKLHNIWHNPTQLLKGNAEYFVEVNFSIRNAHSRAYALGQIERKRKIARWLQSKGKYIFVDLNVGKKHLKDNFLGVPPKWKAYAMRGANTKLPYIVEVFEAACAHAESDEILGLVYGGGSEVEDLCREIEAVYIPERMTEIHKGEGMPAKVHPSEY